MLRVYDEGRLFGETYGEGFARVLWLHGWARTGADFAASARALANEGVASLSVDLPGFGSSPLPRGVGGAEFYADALEGFLGDVVQEPIILVGHSFGGSVALVLAARHPAFVRHLVLTGTPRLIRTEAGSSPWAYRAWRWARHRGLVSEARLARARQRYGSLAYRRAQGPLREILVASVNEDYEQRLASLVVPVTLVWGENDAEVPVATALEAKSRVTSGADVRVLPGVGHQVPIDAPEALSDAVRAALAS